MKRAAVAILVYIGALSACGTSASVTTQSSQTIATDATAAASVTTRASTTEAPTTVAATTTVAAATTTAAPLAPAPPVVEGLTFGNITAAIPAGDVGKVSVVLIGQPSTSSGTTLPVVVRNMTTKTVGSIEVSAGARMEGKLVASGSSQGFNPAVVAPGQVSYGYVYFSSEAPTGSTFDITVQSRTAGDGLFGKINVAVVEANLVPGSFSKEVVGTVTNTGSKPVTGPIEVMVSCFSGDTLVRNFTGFADGPDKLEAGAQATYSVTLYGEVDCPTFVVASSGFDF